MTANIPVIDLAPFTAGGIASRRKVVEAVDAACIDIGFLVIAGHGVAESLIKAMRRVSLEYFDLPDEEKRKLSVPPDAYRGYIGPGSEALSYSLDTVSPPDLKESFWIGPINVPDDPYFAGPTPGNDFAPNMWPERPAGFREIWETYYREMERVAGILMRIFALALGADEHFFEDKIDRHITNFGAIHYPEQITPPLPGQLRAGAHTDYGSLTILKPDNAPGGLQVRGKHGDWNDVPVLDGTFIVNLGDLMAEWTNDRWVSTLHRVVNPPREKAIGGRRLAIPFFHQPNYDAVIECLPTCCSADRPPRYPPTNSGMHRWLKINKHRTPGLSATNEGRIGPCG